MNMNDKNHTNMKAKKEIEPQQQFLALPNVQEPS